MVFQDQHNLLLGNIVKKSFQSSTSIDVHKKQYGIVPMEIGNGARLVTFKI